MEKLTYYETLMSHDQTKSLGRLKWQVSVQFSTGWRPHRLWRRVLTNRLSEKLSCDFGSVYHNGRLTTQQYKDVKKACEQEPSSLPCLKEIDDKKDNTTLLRVGLIKLNAEWNPKGGLPALIVRHYPKWGWLGVYFENLVQAHGFIQEMISDTIGISIVKIGVTLVRPEHGKIFSRNVLDAGQEFSLYEPLKNLRNLPNIHNPLVLTPGDPGANSVKSHICRGDWPPLALNLWAHKEDIRVKRSRFLLGIKSTALWAALVFTTILVIVFLTRIRSFSLEQLLDNIAIVGPLLGSIVGFICVLVHNISSGMKAEPYVNFPDLLEESKRAMETNQGRLFGEWNGR